MLGDSYPHLLKQWHPTLNTDISIDSVTPGSGKKVWWICDKGHEWEAVIRTRTTIGVGCPYCSNRKVCIDNSLATIVPSLALQWHPTKNGTLSPNDVVYGSTKNVWWQCERGHEWRAKVEYRYHKKSGCPFCNLEANSLLTKQPLLCKEWHPSRNLNLTPAKVTQSSHRKVWWLCKEGHEWAAVISSRSRGHGCPYCAGTKRNTVPLIDSHPEAAQLWDGNKNSPLTLNDVDAYSQKVVWWKCPEGHEWEKEIYYQGNKPCSICNSLAHKNPETVKYWDVFKNNPLSPWEISYGSSTVVWWKCKKGHEWQASIAARSNKKFCPKCRGGTSFGEQAIFYYLKKCFSKVENRYKHNSVELDLYIPSLKIGIEYDGKYYHNSNAAKHRDSTKVQVLSKDGIRIIRLRERGLPSLDNFVEVIEFDNLEEALHKLLIKLNKKELIKVNLKQDEDDIYDQWERIGIQKSLGVLEPLISSQWHQTKNNNLTPFDFSPGSNKKIWWECKNKHTWQAPINYRTSGYGCPYCAGQKVSIEKSLAFLNPFLSKEWHSSKNNKLIPEEVMAGSSKKVWWICQKGHEWEDWISNRGKGRGCPFCSGRRSSPEYNLEVIHPDLSLEWHLVKNDTLTPSDVTPGSEKKVWWKCKLGHEWEASVYNRKKGNGCPYCSGRKLLTENSLKMKYPKISKYWHRTRNSIQPEDVFPKSNIKRWWFCDNGHEWQATPNNRTAKGSGCPYCAGQKKI